jgi:hypothetical protein
VTAEPTLAAALPRLSRRNRWDLVGEVPLRFDAGHPQGMVRIDGRWWISTVDIERRIGSVLTVDGDGALVDRTPVGDETRFHPGGMDFDGDALWVASSEYRPRSTAVVERLVPVAGARPQPAFRVDDHVGAIVRLGGAGDLVGWTWGSRRFRRWRVDGTQVAEVRNPSHFVDHQDGQWLGDDLILCAGVATVELAGGPGSLGGLALLRTGDLSLVWELPVPGYSRVTGRAATQNPVFAEVVDGMIVVHLLPDDGHGAILSYATTAS